MTPYMGMKSTLQHTRGIEPRTVEDYMREVGWRYPTNPSVPQPCTKRKHVEEDERHPLRQRNGEATDRTVKWGNSDKENEEPPPSVASSNELGTKPDVQLDFPPSTTVNLDTLTEMGVSHLVVGTKATNEQEGLPPSSPPPALRWRPFWLL